MASQQPATTPTHAAPARAPTGASSTLPPTTSARAQADASAILRLLARSGYKLTGPRRLLADEIARRDRTFTAAEILGAVQPLDPDLGRATVFRTLDCLVRLGAIARVHLDNGSPAYARCDEGCAAHAHAHAPAGGEAGDHTHHHHLICSKCGVVVDLPGCALDPSLERIGREQGFRVLGHRLEVFGECPGCSH